jgi:hypothetical protein
MPDEPRLRAQQAGRVTSTPPDDLRRHLRARLVDGRLFAVVGVSTVRQGTGRPCTVCGRGIDPPAMAREVDGPGVFGIAHEGVCYQMWREESARQLADDVIESEVRQWLRDHQGHAHCAACIARDLQREPQPIQAAMDVLAIRQIFSAGPCGCGRGGLCYGLPVGPRG